jgi:hypothetical protein
LKVPKGERSELSLKFYANWISSNNGLGVASIFVYSEKKSHRDIETALGSKMLVFYACVEMLESPTLAFLWQSKTIRSRIIAVFIDEAHEIAENGHWRPALTRIHKLRAILDKDIDGVNYSIPFVAISATAPAAYRQAVVAHAGLRPDYHLINLGNFRPELFSVVMEMKYNTSSFQDIAFVLPLGATIGSVIETLIYSDDLELLTSMFWWFMTRLASMSLPSHFVDIIHAGLSSAHQDVCLRDFRSGRTKILLASQKIGAGMNFPKVSRVIGYKASGLTVPRWEQRRGRGGRKPGDTSISILFVEPSMAVGGGLTVDNPGQEDPGILDLIQSNAPCSQPIYDFWVENPPRSHHSAVLVEGSNAFILSSQSMTSPDFLVCGRCHRCNPSIIPGRELQWIQVNPANSATEAALHSTASEKEIIFAQLVNWRLELWQTVWRRDWPSYGPKTLVSDVDLRKVTNNSRSIKVQDDLLHYTNLLHWNDLSTPLFQAVQAALLSVHGNLPEIQTVHGDENDMQVDVQVNCELTVTPSHRRTRLTRPAIGRLQHEETVMSFEIF